MRKVSSCTGPVVLSALLIVLFVSHTAAIDCMKYVFAPKCRGISAKRGTEPVAKYPSLSDALDSDYSSPGDYVSDDTAPDSYGFKVGRNRYLKALLRMYLDRRAEDYDV